MNAGPRGWFIAGTDTGVGKTTVAAALLAGLTRRGYRAVGMKPVASGCRQTAGGLRSEDADKLRAASAVESDYADVNPYAFEPAIAPHVAADQAGIEMQLDTVRAHYSRLAALADWVVVEGAGGWYVPLNSTHFMSDVARALGLPVIVVVGLRLGCISHALLTTAAIRADGLPLAGWVGNRVDASFDTAAESVATLEQRLHVRCIGIMPHVPNGETPMMSEESLDRLLESQVPR